MTIIDDRLALLADLNLAEGAHEDYESGVCAMEAVAWLAGEPHSDHPSCASPVLGAFMRTWNDQLPDDERQVLKGYLPRLVGTRKDDALEERLAWMATDWIVRTYTPAWLRLAGLNRQAELVESLAELNPETVPSVRPVLEAARAEASAAGDAAGAAAWAAARAAAGAAAWAAARAAAWDAARAAAWDAARAAAGAAARDAARDAARAAAGAAARDAARAALAPTIEHLQLSALVLLDRMITTAHDHEAVAA